MRKVNAIVVTFLAGTHSLAATNTDRSQSLTVSATVIDSCTIIAERVLPLPVSTTERNDRICAPATPLTGFAPPQPTATTLRDAGNGVLWLTIRF